MNKPASSVRREIFKESCTYLGIIFFVYVILMVALLYDSERSNAHELVKQKNQSINYSIDAHFNDISKMVEEFAATASVREATSLSEVEHQQLTKKFGIVTATSTRITHVYAGYQNDLMLIDTWNVPDGYQPSTRPWYLQAIERSPNRVTGLPYRDVVYNDWLFTTCKAFTNPIDGSQGVVAIDSALGVITDLLNERATEYQSFYSFITDSKGKVIIHGNPDLINHNIDSVMDANVILETSQGFTNYRYADHYKLAFYSTIDETGWRLFTVIDLWEALEPILYKVLGHIVILAFVGLLLIFLFSSVFSRKIAAPMQELFAHVKQLIRKDAERGRHYEFPDNEIGYIAREVVQLTENELYRRSQQLEQAYEEINASHLKLEKQNQLLSEMATSDQLTGIYNRYKLDESLQKEHARAERYERVYSVILFDVDYFKRINDDYGHLVGDKVLQELVGLIRQGLRRADIFGRWGGEEFLIVCPETNLKQALVLAEKLLLKVEAHQFQNIGSLTISLGVSQCQPNETQPYVLKRADDCLYQAKELGRNRVEYLSKG